MGGPRRSSVGCILLLAVTIVGPTWAANAANPSEVSPTTVADSAPEASQAQLIFEKAERAFADGSFVDAARLFEQADRLAPHPSVTFNAAVAWDHAGDSPRAASAYRRAGEREGLSEAQRVQTAERLQELSTRLVDVHFVKPRGTAASVGHVRRQQIPTRFFLEPGEYEVLLEDRQARRTETINVRLNESPRFQFAPVRKPQAPQEPPTPPAAPIEEEPPSAAQETMGWVLLGAGVVASGVAGYLGTQALSAQDDARQESQDAGGLGSTQSTHDRAKRLELQTNIAWGGAGALGATGLILLLTAPTIQF